MAKVKNIAVALILVAIMVAAASVPAACAPPDEFLLKLQKAIDDVVSAAPPAKRSEIKDDIKRTIYASKLFRGASGDEKTIDASKLFRGASGDEKKLDAIRAAYSVAADDAVIAAPAADKFAVMDKYFNEAALASAAPAARSLIAGAPGDEKKVDEVAAYRRIVDAVNAAAPADKFTAMVKEALRYTS